LRLATACDLVPAMARRKPKAKATMGEAQSMESLISLFEGLEDPRVERGCGSFGTTLSSLFDSGL
jgi:hypothetical protein